ncbi:hypothetical protein Pelo_1797 [Pelomyxa schiedti]|nr:hypothetical protein Pelo_1797 [Pelomyxa schiedti]
MQNTGFPAPGKGLLWNQFSSSNTKPSSSTPEPRSQLFYPPAKVDFSSVACSYTPTESRFWNEDKCPANPMEVLIKTTELNELVQYLGTYKKTPIDKSQIFVVSGDHADRSQNVNALVEQMNLNNTKTSCLNVSFSSIVQNHDTNAPLVDPDCLTSNIIHISNVYDSGKTFSDRLSKIQEFTQRAVVIISMDNACLLNTLSWDFSFLLLHFLFSLSFFYPLLFFPFPIFFLSPCFYLTATGVLPTFQSGLHTYTGPNSNSRKATIERIMKVVGACLAGPPFLMRRFLDLAKQYSSGNSIPPFLLHLVIKVWSEAFDKYDIESCKQWAYELRKRFRDTPNASWYTSQVVSLEKYTWPKQLLSTGAAILNKQNFCRLIPLNDTICASIPFPFTSFTNEPGSIFIESVQNFDAWMKSNKGNEFEIIIANALADPCGILLYLNPGWESFNSVIDEPKDTLLVRRKGLWKVDTGSCGTDECVDFVTLGQINYIQIASGRVLKMADKCLDFWRASSARKEDGIYTFLCPEEFPYWNSKELMEFLTRPHFQDGHWKQYQIIQGPVSHCPVAFLYTIDPPGGPYTGICTARSNAYPVNFQHLPSASSHSTEPNHPLPPPCTDKSNKTTGPSETAQVASLPLKRALEPTQPIETPETPKSPNAKKQRNNKNLPAHTAAPATVNQQRRKASKT